MHAATDGAATGRAATKLVCTIGPASESRIGDLIAAGMSVARLNFSHGSPTEHAARVQAIRQAAKAAGREVAILSDLPGPKVRLGALAGGEVALEAGATFTLLAGLDALTGDGDAARAATTHAGLADDLAAGDHLQLSDGAVELVVRSIEGRSIETVVERGGTIRSRAGVNVPAERLSLPPLGERDRSLAGLAVEIGVDLVGQSFVRTATDVEDLRSLLGSGGPAIVAKIETRPAVEQFESVARAADAIMVARGDLGLELPFEAVPLVQKRLVATAVALGKPVIVATQMLESMLTAGRPTRAEVSDVANAVLDGADAVMLSGETAIGAYPVLAAEAAVRIARAAEVGAGDEHAATVSHSAQPGDALAVAAVALAATDPEVACLVAAGRVPRVAVAAASRRPHVPIVAVVPDRRIARRLLLVRGVSPVIPADAATARDPGAVPGDALLADPAVRAALPAAGRAVVVAGSGEGTVERIEAVRIPADAAPVRDAGGMAAETHAPDAADRADAAG